MHTNVLIIEYPRTNNKVLLIVESVRYSFSTGSPQLWSQMHTDSSHMTDSRMADNENNENFKQ